MSYSATTPALFTGATKTHQGRFERAHGGTLFLDELATTSMLVQEKLLRVIEYGEFERVGGSKTQSVDVRLVAATNQDLPSLAKTNKFRADLLDRLAFDVLTLPPLREREEDILLLANHFAVNMAKELGRDLFAGFTAESEDVLQNHNWPGNIRELKNVVERCVYRTEPEALVDEIILNPFASPFRPLEDNAPQITETNPKPAPLATDTNFPIDLKEHIKNHEKDIIESAMEEGKHNQRKAAELLGLSYHQLRGYLKKYSLVGTGAEEDE